MKTAILYGSQIKLSKAHKRIHGNQQPPYYVRIKIIDCDASTALGKAKPLRGEILLNTHELL